MRIPVDQVSPETFVIVEDVILSVHHLVGVEEMLAHVLGHLLFLDNDVTLDYLQWGFGNSLTDHPSNLRQILIDITSINSLHEILNHLHNKQQDMIMPLRRAILPQLHRQEPLKRIILEHDTQTMQTFLKRQENIASQIGIADWVADLDCMVIGRVCDQLDDVFHLLFYVQ